MMSANLYYVWLPVLMMSGYLYCIMACYLYDVFLSVLARRVSCVMSGHLYL